MNAILYFFSQPGCAHCALARPIVEQFRDEHPETFVMELNANRHPGIGDWEPKGTPAFALKVSSILMATHEGGMTLQQIERFVKRGVEGKGAPDEDPAPRRRRRSKKAGRSNGTGASGESGDSGEGDEREPPTGTDAA